MEKHDFEPLFGEPIEAKWENFEDFCKNNPEFVYFSESAIVSQKDWESL